jgi:hypothetical protein
LWFEIVLVWSMGLMATMRLPCNTTPLQNSNFTPTFGAEKGNAMMRVPASHELRRRSNEEAQSQRRSNEEAQSHSAAACRLQLP